MCLSCIRSYTGFSPSQSVALASALTALSPTRLTLICDLTQWEASFLFVFFLLCSPRKTKNRMLWFYDDGQQRVEEPPTLWYQMLGMKPSMRKTKQHSVMIKNLRMRISKICVERKREIGTKKRYITRGNSYKWQPTTFTKGYKVTLYSDCPRATTLYAIHINSPNLGCPKGQCEYGHYTLVFDTLLLYWLWSFLDGMFWSRTSHTLICQHYPGWE